MRRTFDNVDFPLPDGQVARIGTHQAKDGSLTLKLRLPSDYWAVSGVWRAAEGNGYRSGKTVITLDRGVR